MDQIEALRWVKRNIASFGGDPDQITVLGHEAGAESAYSLLASPKAVGLFHRVIGTSEAVTALEGMRDYKRVAQITREEFFEYNSLCVNTTDLRQCLQSLDVSDFERYLPFPSGFFKPSPLYKDPGGLVVVDPVVLPVSPWNLPSIPLPDRKIPVLMGSLAQEVGFFYAYDLAVDSNETYMQQALLFLNDFNASTMAQQLSSYYPSTIKNGSEDVVLKASQKWQTFMSDVIFTCPVNKLADTIAESPNHDVYRFYIEHQLGPKNSQDQLYAFQNLDILALFNFKFFNINPDPHDERLRDVLRAMYKKFIHEGDVDNEWKKVPSTTKVIRNAPEDIFVVGDPQERQCKWLSDNGVTRWAEKWEEVASE